MLAERRESRTGGRLVLPFWTVCQPGGNMPALPCCALAALPAAGVKGGRWRPRLYLLPTTSAGNVVGCFWRLYGAFLRAIASRNWHAKSESLILAWRMRRRRGRSHLAAPLCKLIRYLDDVSIISFQRVSVAYAWFVWQ